MKTGENPKLGMMTFIAHRGAQGYFIFTCNAIGPNVQMIRDVGTKTLSEYIWETKGELVPMPPLAEWKMVAFRMYEEAQIEEMFATFRENFETNVTYEWMKNLKNMPQEPINLASEPPPPTEPVPSPLTPEELKAKQKNDLMQRIIETKDIALFHTNLAQFTQPERDYIHEKITSK